MPNAKNLMGQRFGKLTVIEKVGLTNQGRVLWKCLCDCGNYSDVRSDQLVSGNTKSCGCLQKEITSNIKTKHGKCKTRIYKIWDNMKDRCNNEKCRKYKDYGARGIIICEEWKEFENFYNWSMENGYRDDLTIDRIDVNGNYEPSNCRWATAKEQGNNKRNNNFIEFMGETKTQAMWADEIGLPYGIITNRLKNGWSVEKTFTTPIREHKPYEYKRKNQNISVLS